MLTVKMGFNCCPEALQIKSNPIPSDCFTRNNCFTSKTHKETN